jgi:ACS family tartrate transporter-like MFS transporter
MGKWMKSLRTRTSRRRYAGGACWAARDTERQRGAAHPRDGGRRRTRIGDRSSDFSLPLSSSLPQRIYLPSSKRVSACVLPLIMAACVMQALDRGALAFAAADLNDELGLSGTQYGLASGLFYLSYGERDGCALASSLGWRLGNPTPLTLATQTHTRDAHATGVFQMPSASIGMQLGMRWWYGLIVLLWGVTASATALVQTAPQVGRGLTGVDCIHRCALAPEQHCPQPLVTKPHAETHDPRAPQLYAMRLLLGAFEAGASPCAWHVLSAFYPYGRLTKPYATVIMSTAISSAVSGPIAAALLSLHGTKGLSGWRWLFLVEGLPAILVGLAVWGLLPSEPLSAWWLPPRQREALHDAVGGRRGGAACMCMQGFVKHAAAGQSAGWLAFGWSHRCMQARWSCCVLTIAHCNNPHHPGPWAGGAERVHPAAAHGPSDVGHAGGGGAGAAALGLHGGRPAVG